MKQLKYVFLSPLFFLALSQQAWSQKISFDQLATMIKKENQSLKAQGHLIDASKAREGVLSRSFFPTVDIEGGFESSEGEFARAEKGFATVSARLNLLRGGRDLIEDQNQKGTTKLTALDSEAQQLKLLTDAQSLYRAIQGMIQLHKIHQTHIKELEKVKRAGLKRVQNKIAQESEVLLIDYALLKEKAAIRELLLEIDENKTELAVILGLDEHKSLSFEERLPYPNQEWVELENTTDKHPELKKISLRQDLLQNHSKQKEAWRQHELSLYTHYGRPSLSSDAEVSLENKNESTIGLSLSFSLDDMFNNRSDRVAHSYEQMALKQQQIYVINEKKAYDHEIRHDLEVTHELILDNKKERELAQRIATANFSAYQRGAISTSEMTQTLELQLESQKNEIELLISYGKNLAQLRYLNP